MTLSTRVSLFFLIALATVLAGVSLSLYGVARWHLYHQLDERSAAALEALTAVDEVKPAGLEWEPNERVLAFRAMGADGRLGWEVFDEEGRRVDGSRGPGALSFLEHPASLAGSSVKTDLAWEGSTLADHAAHVERTCEGKKGTW